MSSENGRYVSFRVSGRDIEVLETLMKQWGENQSQTIRRALQMALQGESKNGNIPKLPDREED